MPLLIFDTIVCAINISRLGSQMQGNHCVNVESGLLMWNIKWAKLKADIFFREEQIKKPDLQEPECG